MTARWDHGTGHGARRRHDGILRDVHDDLLHRWPRGHDRRQYAEGRAEDDEPGDVEAVVDGECDASSRDPAMTALIDADPTHADVAGVPAHLLATTSQLARQLQRRYHELTIPLRAMHWY